MLDLLQDRAVHPSWPSNRERPSRPTVVLQDVVRQGCDVRSHHHLRSASSTSYRTTVRLCYPVYQCPQVDTDTISCASTGWK